MFSDSSKISKLQTIILVVSFWILCVSVFPALAATFYIDYANGNDTRTVAQAQSSSTPWKHCPGMNGASGNAASYNPQPGDKFYLRRGITWPNQALPLNIKTNGNSSGWIVYGAYGTGENPTLDAGNTDTYGIVIGGRDYIKIENLRIINPKTYGIFNSSTTLCSNITIDNCYISLQSGNGSRACIEILGKSNSSTSNNILVSNSVMYNGDNSTFFCQYCDNVTLDNNKIYGSEGNTRDQADGIGTRDGTNWEIRNNEVYIRANDKGCASSNSCKHSDGIHNNGTDNMVVANNWIEIAFDESYTSVKNKDGIITGYGISDGRIVTGLEIYNNVLVARSGFAAAAWLGRSTGTKFYNNTVYCKNSMCYYDGTSDATNHSIKNNIFYRADNNVIADFNSTVGHDIDHNVWYRPDGRIQIMWGGNNANSLSKWQGYGNDRNGFVENPEFVSTNTYNLKLSQSSCGVDAGTNLSGEGVTTTYDGLSRPLGSAYDIGAYEYSSGGSTTPPQNQLSAPTNLHIVNN